MKNNSSSIDIIMPNFNKGPYLKEAIESVINQTYKNWRLYIIDDCSSDQSNEIINDHTHKNVNDIGKIPAGLKSNEIRHDNGMKKWIETLRN